MALQDAERRRDALIGTALGAWNKRALRLQSEREEARTLMDEMIAESQMRERQERERMRAAAPWQMALSGAGTGAAIGSAVAPGLGTAIGAGVGARGGALFGASSPDSVGRVAPYVGMAGQAAQMYKGQHDQRDFYADMARGRGSAAPLTPPSLRSRVGGGGDLPRFQLTPPDQLGR